MPLAKVARSGPLRRSSLAAALVTASLATGCSTSDGAGWAICASSIGSPAMGCSNGCIGAADGTVRSTVSVRLGISSRAHARIADAIHARNPDAAHAAMRLHLRSVAARLFGE